MSKEINVGHIVSKAPNELSYIKQSSYMKIMTTQNNWTFDLGVGDSVDIPIYVIVGFRQREKRSIQSTASK